MPAIVGNFCYPFAIINYNTVHSASVSVSNCIGA